MMPGTGGGAPGGTAGSSGSPGAPAAGAGGATGGGGAMGGGAGGIGGGGGPGAPDAAAPGSAPTTGIPNQVPAPPPRPLADNEVTFDPPGSGFTDGVMVKLTARAPGAVIHFTVDGSLPTRASPVFRAPVAIRETTVVRALVASGGADGPVAASVYLKLGADVAGFSSNLPVVVLHTQRAGVLPILGSDMVSGSASVFEPRAGGRTTLNGPAAVSARAGVRIRGNSSRAFPQKSYAFELRAGGSDEDEGEFVAGMPSEADWALVAPSWVDRSLIRTALAFGLSRSIGRYAPRVRLCEAFVVETGGAVAMASYLGVFALTEKIERDKDRVAVDVLPADATGEPLVTGGYVFRVDHEVFDFQAGGLNFGFVYPEPEEMALPERQPQKVYLQRQMQEFSEALAGPGFKHPRTGKSYADYVDVGSFIDINLLQALIKNVDAFRFSSYFHKARGGKVVMGPIWDVDRSAGSTHDDGARATSPTEWARLDGTNPLTWVWFGRLGSDPAWKSAHARRWKELAAGPFSPATIHASIDRLAAEVAEAQRRHFARWAVMTPEGGSHEHEIEVLKSFFTARVPWISSQLTPGP
jgi:hypothetical protein